MPDDRHHQQGQLSRLPGEGIDHGIDDDGIVHDMDFIGSVVSGYGFKCRKSVYVYDRDSDDYEEVKAFSPSQAKSLEHGGPTTCLDCIARKP